MKYFLLLPIPFIMMAHDYYVYRVYGGQLNFFIVLLLFSFMYVWITRTVPFNIFNIYIWIMLCISIGLGILFIPNDPNWFKIFGRTETIGFVWGVFTVFSYIFKALLYKQIEKEGT